MRSSLKVEPLKPPARILIYSDQPILAAGFDWVIAADGRLKLVATCSTIAELYHQLSSQTADVAIVDLTPEITTETLAKLHHTNIDCKLILWTTTIAPDFALRALSLGVRGVLNKTLSLEAHRQCLHRIHAGELWYERHLTDSFRDAHRISLTPREGQLMTLLSRGLRNRQISYELGISEGTVKVYLSRLFQKCGATNRLEMAVFSRQQLSTPGTMTAGAGCPSITVEPL